MRVARLHEPNHLSIDDVDSRPVRPGTVRIDIEYCGVCGSDLHEYQHGPAPIRREYQNHRIPKSEWEEHLPMPMGHEIVGTVNEVGEDVDRIDRGQEPSHDTARKRIGLRNRGNGNPRRLRN